jgi:hypothetical protein
MAGGKYRYDSGRSRSARFKHRSQANFDDTSIRGFVENDDEEFLHEMRTLPVRYGSRRLADHLSDSTLAAAILASGDLGERAEDDRIDLEMSFPETLFDIPTDESSEPERVAASPWPGEGERESSPAATLRSAFHLRRTAGAHFSLSGLLQGFLIGAGATAALLILVSLIR